MSNQEITYECATIEGWSDYLPFTPPDWLAIRYGTYEELYIIYPAEKFEEVNKILENVSYYHPCAECLISSREITTKEMYEKVMKELKELREERFKKFIREKMINSEEISKIIEEKVNQRIKQL